MVARVGVLGGVDTDNLYLAELVQTVESAHIFAVRACFAAEALGVGAVLNRQLRLFDNLITVEVRYGHLGGGDEVEVVHFAVVHLPLFVGQLSCAVATGLVDYRRRHNLRVAGFVGFGEEEVDECALQACALPDIDGETCT